jgi:hypothetical protein
MSECSGYEIIAGFEFRTYDKTVYGHDADGKKRVYLDCDGNFLIITHEVANYSECVTTMEDRAVSVPVEVLAEVLRHNGWKVEKGELK